MARRTQPPPPRLAEITVEQMKLAIPKLRRRIEEMEAFDVGMVSDRGDPRIEALNHKIDDMLMDIFGNDTVEDRRYRIDSIDEAPTIIGYNMPVSTS